MSSTVPKVSLHQIVAVLERAVNEIVLGYKMIKNSSSGKGRKCFVYNALCYGCCKSFIESLLPSSFKYDTKSFFKLYIHPDSFSKQRLLCPRYCL